MKKVKNYSRFSFVYVIIRGEKNNFVLFTLMDTKTKSEARRRKILENAELRLKKIVDLKTFNDASPNKEELKSEVENVESVSCKEELKTEVKNVEEIYKKESKTELKSVEETSSHVDNVPVNKNFTIEEHNYCKSHKSSIEEPKINNVNVSFVKKEPSLLLNDSTSLTTDSLTLQKDPIAKLPKDKKEPSLLTEETSRQTWIEKLLILLLGVIIRFAYHKNYSWIFYESMWVPFFTLVLPLVFAAVSGSQPPQGIVDSICLSICIMSGISSHTLHKYFMVASLFRTLMQYFSLYLFSFLISHVIISGVT